LYIRRPYFRKKRTLWCHPGEQQRHLTATKRRHNKFRKGSTPRRPLHTPDSPTAVLSLASIVRNCIFFCHHLCPAGSCACSKQQNLVRPPVRRHLLFSVVDCCNLALRCVVTSRAFVLVSHPCCFGSLAPQDTPTHTLFLITLLRPFLSFSPLAISGLYHALDRLSPLSVSTVECQVRRPVQRTSILAWVGLIGVSLRFVGGPLDYVTQTSFTDLVLCYYSIMPRFGSIVALSVSTVECQVRRPVRSTSILAWVELIGDSSRFVKAPPWLYIRATVSFIHLVPCYFAIVLRS
jgi:hypothetical protein